MEITEKQLEGCILVTLDGRLDSGSTDALQEKLAHLTENSGDSILIDCETMDYVGSAGLRVLLVALKTLRPLGRQLALASLSPQVKQVFEISGFNGIFSIYENAEEGVNKLCG